MSSEKDHLIQKANETNSSLNLRRIIILLALFFIYVSLGIFGYVVNEWTQSKIQHEKFANMSKDRDYEACNATNHSDPAYKNYKSVQQETSVWMLYYSIAQHIPMFFMNTILVGYTDVYGRKFVFVLASLGSCVKTCTIALIIYFNTSMWYIAAAYAFDGMLGSSYALFAVSSSYVADITVKENHRVFGIVIIEANMIATTICSSLLSGYFIKDLNYFNTSVICAALCLIGFLIMILLLPETLHQNRRRPVTNAFDAFKTMIRFYLSDDIKGKRLLYILLLLSFFFALVAGLNRGNIETLYLLGQPFCWGPSKIGVFAMTRHAAVGIIGLGSLKLLQTRLSNEAVAVLSTVSCAGSLLIEAFATSTLMIYMVPVVGTFSFLMIPLIRGMMSTITDPDKQGAMFSGVATIEVLGSIFASLSLNEVYAKTYSFMNGFVFLVMTGFLVIDFILLLVVYYLRIVRTQVYETVKTVK